MVTSGVTSGTTFEGTGGLGGAGSGGLSKETSGNGAGAKSALSLARGAACTRTSIVVDVYCAIA